jgi:hypothetical protein
MGDTRCYSSWPERDARAHRHPTVSRPRPRRNVVIARLAPPRLATRRAPFPPSCLLSRGRHGEPETEAGVRSAPGGGQPGKDTAPVGVDRPDEHRRAGGRVRACSSGLVGPALHVRASPACGPPAGRPTPSANRTRADRSNTTVRAASLSFGTHPAAPNSGASFVRRGVGPTQVPHLRFVTSGDPTAAPLPCRRPIGPLAASEKVHYGRRRLR